MVFWLISTAFQENALQQYLFIRKMSCFSEKLLFDCLNLDQYAMNSQESQPQHQKTYLWQGNSKNQKYQIDEYAQEKGKIEMLVSTNVGQDYPNQYGTQQFAARNQQESRLYCSLQVQARPVTFITPSPATQNKLSIVRKGFSNETQNIGKHLKSITLKFLNLLIDAKILNHSQQILVNKFSETNGGLKDFKDLFSSSSVRQKCKQFYTSVDFVRVTLSESRMDMYSKLMMLKYMARLRSLTYRQVKSWINEDK